MKKFEWILLAFVALLLTSCKKNEPKIYTEKPAVYFATFSTTDSLTHSLVGSKTNNDTVFIKIQLLGNALNQDKSFKLIVDQQYTTATETKHYEKLKDSYLLPAGAFSVLVPVVFYKTDPDLQTKSYRLGIKVISSGDTDAGYANRINAHIIFTNQLVKPSWWDSYLLLYYGAYSRTKHAKAVELQQFDFPAEKPTTTSSPKLSEAQPVYQTYGRLLSKYYTDNVVNDENGNRIVPWAPL